jgi:hypothetical protein
MLDYDGSATRGWKCNKGMEVQQGVGSAKPDERPSFHGFASCLASERGRPPLLSDATIRRLPSCTQWPSAFG